MSTIDDANADDPAEHKAGRTLLHELGPAAVLTYGRTAFGVRILFRARSSTAPRGSAPAATPSAMGEWSRIRPGPLTALLVEQRGEFLRREDPVALGHKFTDLLPVGVMGEHYPDAATAGSRGEERVANGQQRVAFVWVGA